MRSTSVHHRVTSVGLRASAGNDEAAQAARMRGVASSAWIVDDNLASTDALDRGKSFGCRSRVLRWDEKARTQAACSSSGENISDRSALSAAWVRLCTPSLSRMALTCDLTVVSATYKDRAISLFVRPIATSRNT